MVEPERRAASYTDKGDSPASVSVDELLNLADLEQAAANYESAIRTYRRVLDGNESLVHLSARRARDSDTRREYARSCNCDQSPSHTCLLV